MMLRLCTFELCNSSVNGPDVSPSYLTYTNGTDAAWITFAPAYSQAPSRNEDNGEWKYSTFQLLSLTVGTQPSSPVNCSRESTSTTRSSERSTTAYARSLRLGRKKTIACRCG